MEKKQYVCPKCQNTTFESDQFQATGGNFERVFNIQNKKFITVSCKECGFTELYKATTSTGWNVLDFLVG
ncbi:MAG: zinc ribbon domain-containing protein [Clostridium sp.]